MSGRRRWAESASVCVCVYVCVVRTYFLGCDGSDGVLRTSGEVFHWTSIQQSVKKKPLSPPPILQGANKGSEKEVGSRVGGAGGSVWYRAPSAGSHYCTDVTL